MDDPTAANIRTDLADGVNKLFLRASGGGQ
jgi:hypothetical protein